MNNRADLFEGLSIWEDEKYRVLQGQYPVVFLSFANAKGGSFDSIMGMGAGDPPHRCRFPLRTAVEENEKYCGRCLD